MSSRTGERDGGKEGTNLLLVEHETGKFRLGDLSRSSRCEESSKVLQEDEELDENLSTEGNVCQLGKPKRTREAK